VKTARKLKAVDLFCGAGECVGHSNAKGDAPVDDRFNG